jgi:hypothetical protein
MPVLTHDGLLRPGAAMSASVMVLSIAELPDHIREGETIALQRDLKVAPQLHARIFLIF